MTFMSFTVSENEKQNMKLMHKYLKLIETEKPCFVADLLGNGRDRVKGLGLPDIVLSGYGLLQIVYSCKYTKLYRCPEQLISKHGIHCDVVLHYYIVQLQNCSSTILRTVLWTEDIHCIHVHCNNVLQHHNGYTVILE